MVYHESMRLAATEQAAAAAAAAAGAAGTAAVLPATSAAALEPPAWQEPQKGDTWRWLLMRLGIRDWFIFSAMHNEAGGRACGAGLLQHRLGLLPDCHEPCCMRASKAAAPSSRSQPL